MGTRDARVDAYIAKSADFARPILEHLRDVVHAACPQVEETIKWGMPSFQHHGILAGMAAFKQHCAFNLWKNGRVIADEDRSRDGMGHFGRITSVRDLPAKRTLVGYVKESARINEERAAAKKATAKKATAKR